MKKGAGYHSSYGKQGDNSGSQPLLVNGMGPVGSKAMTPDNISAVMFVEVNYDYQPVIGTWVLGAKKSQ